MAIANGERFVQRHNAARTSTSNTTAADISYDTSVLSEGGYSWSTPEVTVDTAGKYLTIFDIGQVDIASTRAVGTLVPSVNTVDQDMYRATHRYLRNSGGSQEGASIGMTILDLAVNDDVKVRMPGAGSNGTSAVGNYATNASYGGGLQLIYLGDNNYTEVQRTTSLGITLTHANTTRPWLDSTGSWTQLTFDSEVNDDDNLYGGTGGDVTLKANKKYLVVYGGSFNGTSSQRQEHVVRVEIDGTNVQYASGYERNNASDNPPMNGMYLHEVGGTDETLKFYGTTEQEDAAVSNTVTCSAFYAQVYELPDTAEWVHADNSTTDSLATALAGLTTWYDTPLSSTFRADGNSNLSVDTVNDAIQNDSGASLPVLAIGWHKWDRDSSASGTRKNPWTRWDNGGSAVGYGVAGAFSRGQQDNDDTWQAHYTSAVTLDLANAADLKFQVNDEASASNDDIGIYASTASNRHFLGVQVLDLSTLSSATVHTILSDDLSLSLTEDAGTITQNHIVASQDISLGLTEDATTITQNHVIAPDDLSLGVVADNTTVDQTHTIEANDLSLGLTEDNSSLTQNHIIAPDDLTLGVVADNGTISQVHLLEPDDIAMSLLTDVTSMTQNHIIATLDVALDMTESSPTIDVTHIVETQDLSLTPTTDNTTLLQNHIIVPQDIALGVVADNGTIDLSHIIDPQDIAFSLTADNTTIVEDAATDHEISPDDLSLALTEDNATIAQNHVIAPQDISLTLTVGELEGLSDGLLMVYCTLYYKVAEYIFGVETDSEYLYISDTLIDLNNDSCEYNTLNYWISQNSGGGLPIGQNHIIASQDISMALTEDNAVVDHITEIDIYPNDISLGLTEDNTSLTQNHIISVNDIALGVVADNGTITQNHIIASDDLSLASAADSTTITQNHVISPDDITLGVVADNTTIGQNHVIASGDLSLALTEDNSSLTQNHIIDSQDISLGLTEDNTTVEESYNITVQDISLALTEDATTINQNHIIDPADITLGVVADNTDITQNHIIASQDTSLGLTTDLTSVTQNHIIETQDVSLALTEDATTISQNHVIAVDDLTLGVVADNGTISQNHVVASQDLSIALTEDNTTITQNHIITPQDIALGVVADNGTITQNHIIDPADISIVLTEDNVTVTEQINNARITSTGDTRVTSTGDTRVHI